MVILWKRQFDRVIGELFDEVILRAGLVTLGFRATEAWWWVRWLIGQGAGDKRLPRSEPEVFLEDDSDAVERGLILGVRLNSVW